MTPEQASAFLRALWPEGSNSYLANHPRTFFEALLGNVPTDLPRAPSHTVCIEQTKALGKTLIALGNVMMSEAMKAEQK